MKGSRFKSAARMRQFTMNLIRNLLCAAAVAVFAGCATGKWTGENIPYPVSTPYDMNVQARAAYLDGFQQGYRSQKSSGISRVETLTGPFVQARQEGFYLGAAQARAELEGAH
jgi:hypothetical protein